MRPLLRLAICTLLILVLRTSAATASPVVCEDILNPELGTSSVDSALFCDGPFVGNDDYRSGSIEAFFGFIWQAQDEDDDEGPLNGAGEDVLTLTGIGGNSGTFTIDPSLSNCDAQACHAFIVVLKWGDAFAYWSLGELTDITSFDWTAGPDVLAHASLYGRFDEGVLLIPEPASLLLVGTGIGGALLRRRRKA